METENSKPSLPIYRGESAQNVLPPTDESTHEVENSGQGQCPSWNDGYCPEGKNCKMHHLIDPNGKQAERLKIQEQAAAKTTIHRTIFDTTKVVFGAGCEIREVTTALESHRVLISHLPAQTTKETLADFVTFSGFNRESFCIPVLRVGGDRETQEASVIFNDICDAKVVVNTLKKRKYLGNVLKFELAPVLADDQMDLWTYDRSSYLGVTFGAPSKCAQAIYPTVGHAMEKAKALDGRCCNGRIVRVTVARKPEKQENWTYIKNSIIISNLALDTPDSDIFGFAQPFSIGTFKHRRFDVDTVLWKLEDHMRTIGGLKPGDFYFVQNEEKGTVLIRGRFDTWEKADEVYRSLQETHLGFLAPTNALFFLAFPHQYSLNIPPPQYGVQKEIFDALESQHGRDRAAHVVVTRYRSTCLIQVVGTDKKAVGVLKLKVEKIARGEVVKVWDRFFLNSQGDALFARLLRQFKAHVRPDKTRQVLRIYGSEAAVNHARREIEEQVNELAWLDHQMTIPDHCIAFFVRNGMKVLGDMFGEENVCLHTTSKPYFVSLRGGHDVDHALQQLISEVLEKPLQPPTSGRSQICPICLDVPVQPFSLACGHKYCNGCLHRRLLSTTDGKSISICCIGDGDTCKAPIPLPVIERFISPARLSQMFENSFKVYLEQRPDGFRLCSTPGCTQIYRVSKDPTVIQCPTCLIEACSCCHKSPHRGLTCDGNALKRSRK